MDIKTVRDLIYNGASLSTNMVPDTKIPTNHPLHVESYQLPFIKIQSNHSFVASALDHHWMMSVDNPWKFRHASPNNYFYTAGKQTLFGSTNIKDQSYILMNMIRYGEFNWNIRDNYQLVWDTGDEKVNDIEALRQFVASGVPTKTVILDKGAIHQMPLDLLQVNLEDNEWMARTLTFVLPQFFAEPLEQELQLIQEAKAVFKDANDLKAYDFFDSPIAHFWYLLRQDGSGSDYHQARRKGEKQTFERVRVFVEKESVTATQKISRLEMEKLVAQG